MKAWTAFVVGAVLLLMARPAAAAVGYPVSRSAAVPADLRLATALQDSDVQARLERLVLFTPDRRVDVVQRVAAQLRRELGGPAHGYDAFLRARMRDFQSILARYDLRPNDLSTARAFAIVAGYKAYNGDHLTDTTSGSILRTMLALQTAAPQWYDPWSDTRKQGLYVTWALQGSVLNWLDDEARRHSNAAAHAAVRAEARSFLERQLGRNPDTVKLDRFACAVYRDEDCRSLMRTLRAAFAGSTATRSP